MKFYKVVRGTERRDPNDKIGYLREDCEDKKNCTGNCHECFASIDKDATLADLHSQIINVVLHSDPGDKIVINTEVFQKVTQNTVNYINDMIDDMRESIDKLDGMYDYIRLVQNNMDYDVDYKTAMALYKYIKNNED